MKVVLCLGVIAVALPTRAAEPTEKAYIALEGEGRIAVLDTQTRQIIRQIDVTETINGTPVMFAPHNVQVAPDGRSVWVTANVHGHHGHAETGHEPEAPARDQVIVIDPTKDVIVRRIPVAPRAHLSHVVVTTDGKTAYVNAQEEHRVYRIDADTYRILGFTSVAGQGPHGIRLTPVGSRGYLAMIQGNSMGVLDTVSGGMSYLPVGGAAIQTAVCHQSVER